MTDNINPNRTNQDSKTTLPRLGVNIDHVATLRQARGVDYPSPLTAAKVCFDAGAKGITIHLREDRRHIQDHDVYDIKKAMNEGLDIPMNLEIAVTDEMVTIACDVLPEWVCLVPEKRAELTTEGGLDVCSQIDSIAAAIATMQAVGIKISLFIDPNNEQIDAAIKVNADAIEIHTGQYAEATLEQNEQLTQTELQRIIDATAYAQSANPALIINAGHGLTRDNVAPIAKIAGMHELNIGHALIADAVFMGLHQAVIAMQEAMQQ